MPIISKIRTISDTSDTLQKYDQGSDAADIFPFQGRNLLYGYNGSGKTTISRIFQYLGSGDAPRGLGMNFGFEIILSNGKRVN